MDIVFVVQIAANVQNVLSVQVIRVQEIVRVSVVLLFNNKAKRNIHKIRRL